MPTPTTTPKFDKIIAEFGRRINMPVTLDPANGATFTVTGILSEADYVAYINKAMFKIMGEAWKGLAGDAKKFAQLFPELYRTADVTITAGSYTIAASNLDFYYLIDGFATISNVTYYLQVLNATLYPTVKSGVNSRFIATLAYPKAFLIGNAIKVEPASSYANQPVTIGFIKAPLMPATGAFITRNNPEVIDSPFLDIWNSQIAETAEQLYRIDTQETL